MPVAKRKPAEAVAPAPQFHIVPREGESMDRPQPAKPAVKGLNIAGLKTAASKDGDKARILNPSPELIETLTQFIEHKPKLTALEGTVKALSARAGMLAKPEWFRFFHGRGDAASSMVVSVDGRDVSLVFQRRYSSKADANALAAMGVSKHFREFSDAIQYRLREARVSSLLLDGR